jgi:hypothetical protein
MAIDRYLANDKGFRKYVELLETTPSRKRQQFLDAALKENRQFAEAAQACIITFERITKLPEMEIAEVMGAPGLKPEVMAAAILSVEDLGVQANLVKAIPRKIVGLVQAAMKDFPFPQPNEVGAARLAFIEAARALERQGLLVSFLIPRFGDGYFRSKRK